MSLKGRLLGALGGLVLKEAEVTGVEVLAPHLRRVQVAGASLRGVDWTPGDKVQLVLANADTRTYTPCAWDAERGATHFLVVDHGGGPGAAWARSVRVGESVRFVGPQRSIRAPSGAVVFGDETSFGLVEALGGVGVLEVSDRDAAAAFRGLHPGATCVPVDGDRHYDAVVAAIIGAGAGRTVVLSGRARSIQAVRAGLTARGAAVPTQVRAYWADGKKGLD